MNTIIGRLRVTLSSSRLFSRSPRLLSPLQNHWSLEFYETLEKNFHSHMQSFWQGRECILIRTNNLSFLIDVLQRFLHPQLNIFRPKFGNHFGTKSFPFLISFKLIFYLVFVPDCTPMWSEIHHHWFRLHDRAIHLKIFKNWSKWFCTTLQSCIAHILQVCRWTSSLKRGRWKVAIRLTGMIRLAIGTPEFLSETASL